MELSKNINLALEMIRTDFKLRYHGSYLGYLWSFLNPLMMFGVLYIVFSKFLHIDYPNYALNLFLGIIIWNFFAQATSDSMASLIAKGGLMKKIYFPRVIIIFSSTAVSFINLVSNLAVFALFYYFSGLPPDWTILLFPIYLFELFIITFGIGLAVSALNTKFRDLMHMWQVLLQVGFWGTPITYLASNIPETYRFLIIANPFAAIISNSRLVLIEHHFFDVGSSLYAFAAGVIALAAGYFILSRRVPYFTEEV